MKSTAPVPTQAVLVTGCAVNVFIIIGNVRNYPPVILLAMKKKPTIGVLNFFSSDEQSRPVHG